MVVNVGIPSEAVKAVSEQNVYSQIFRPITTARLQVVAEKSGMFSWGDNKFIDFL